MEESPHKCPVCSRSFNQRSNLKTHLLTHTDHKPYECNSCGKVFRRNCDLRRHTLTHAVGDVPGEYVDVVEEEEEGRNLSGDEEDSLLEVDSPRNSPVQRHLSGSPTHEFEGEHDDDDELEGDQRISMAERLTLKRKAQFDREALEDDSEDELADENEDEEEELPEKDPKPTIKQEIAEKNQRKPDADVVDGPSQYQGVTHCHHEGGTQYTMRPTHELQRNGEEPLLISAASLSGPPDYILSSSATGIPNYMGPIPGHMTANETNDPYMPLLHVRRDLHSKPLMPGPTDLKVQIQPGGMPPGAMPVIIDTAAKTQPTPQPQPPPAPLHSPHEPVPSFLGSIPIRKRALGVEFEHMHAHALSQRPPTFVSNANMYALNMSRPHLHALQSAAAASALKLGSAVNATVAPSHLGPPPPGMSTKPGPYLPTNYHINAGPADKVIGPPSLQEQYLHHPNRSNQLEGTSTPPNTSNASANSSSSSTSSSSTSSSSASSSATAQRAPHQQSSASTHCHNNPNTQAPPAPAPAHAPAPAPVKRSTGFSIEDIMRR